VPDSRRRLPAAVAPHPGAWIETRNGA